MCCVSHPKNSASFGVGCVCAWFQVRIQKIAKITQQGITYWFYWDFFVASMRKHRSGKGGRCRCTVLQRAGHKNCLETGFPGGRKLRMAVAIGEVPGLVKRKYICLMRLCVVRFVWRRCAQLSARTIRKGLPREQRKAPGEGGGHTAPQKSFSLRVSPFKTTGECKRSTPLRVCTR